VRHENNGYPFSTKRGRIPFLNCDQDHRKIIHKTPQTLNNSLAFCEFKELVTIKSQDWQDIRQEEDRRRVFWRHVQENHYASHFLRECKRRRR
jgi:DNA polymerase III psi subunit